MKYRILSLVLALALALALCPAVALAAEDEASAAAEQLYELGLFQGTGTDEDGNPVFALDQEPTRAEAVVMLLRLLGLEDEVEASDYETPFTDVPDSYWAASYIGYAYHYGLTSGVAEDRFGLESGDTVTAAQYVTFMLRALGYDDGAGDFTVDHAVAFAQSVGFTIESDWVEGTFTRGDVALISYYGLAAQLKGSDETLADSLGLYSYEADLSSASAASSEENQALTAYSADEIESLCAPSVFQIIVYDKYGNATSEGSGFFIDSSGIAVTCYHVIYNTSSAKVTLTRYNNQTYSVSKVIYCDAKEDIAVLKVSNISIKGAAIDSFPSLTLSSQTLQSGDEVYAIGHPNGGDLTVSEGSYIDTTVQDYKTYYRAGATIYPGSSGGALINEYGQVVGITAALITDEPSVSLSIPISVLAEYDLTGSGSTYSTTSTVRSDQYALSASQYSITVSRGKVGEITLTDVYKTGSEFSCKSRNNRIADCGWDSDTLDPDNMKLQILGKRTGTTSVVVTLYDSDGNQMATAVIEVTVT
ncbi:MAG: hypothetical protein H6Q60_1039 [Oscillospiraceae bacterium]|nr:hypothetical protein [Oscillospiraceae bacterium]